MGEYEPDDSRDVTLGKPNNPVEPDRTGAREGEARDKARADGKGEPVKGRPTA